MRSEVDASVIANKRAFPVRIFISNILHGFLVYLEQIKIKIILAFWVLWIEYELLGIDNIFSLLSNF